MIQTWILVTIFILFLMGTTIMFYSLDRWHCCFEFARKAFLSIVFPIIKVRPRNMSNWDSHNNLHSFYDWALQSCSPHWDTRNWCFGFAWKAFHSTIFHIVKVHVWDKANIDTRNNLHSFCYRHYNQVLHFGIHDIGALDLREQLFFLPFSL